MLTVLQAGMGWALGAAAPISDRRLRIGCTLAALLPAADTLLLLSGTAAYDRFHPGLSHGALAGLLCAAAAAWGFRRYPDRVWLGAMLVVPLAFALHVGIDLLLAPGAIQFLWPLSRRGFEVEGRPGAGSAVYRLAQGLLVLPPCAVMAWKAVTPIEMLSPALDDFLTGLFRPRKHPCSVCKRKCNHRCRLCTHPVCLRHARIGAHFRVTCRSCLQGSAPAGPAGNLDDYLAKRLNFVRSKEAFRLDPEFAAFLDRKLSDGLGRLNGLPRSHPFWEGSDQRATLAKLADLCRFLLKETSDDDEARWVLFADQILTGSADLGYSAIEPLLLRDLGSLRWLVSAARWSYLVSGLDPVVALRGPFSHLGRTVGSAETCFRELAQDSNAHTREAGRVCLELLQGINPFKA